MITAKDVQDIPSQIAALRAGKNLMMVAYAQIVDETLNEHINSTLDWSTKTRTFHFKSHDFDTIFSNLKKANYVPQKEPSFFDFLHRQAISILEGNGYKVNVFKYDPENFISEIEFSVFEKQTMISNDKEVQNVE